MAKHEGEFDAAEEATLDARELIAALRRPAPASSVERNEAIANCLSGGDGWRDSATRLGGAFAATRLTSGKE